jgi:hypothetical protein
MFKFIRNLFKGRKQQCNIPVVTKRFEFGIKLDYKDKPYRYLYTYGDNDVFMRDDDEPRIFFIPSRFIVD